jgi:hypothetical protein
VAWLDIHTALGEYGTAECIVEYPEDSPSLDAANALWGSRVRNTKTSDSLSPDVAGSISYGMHQILGDDLVMAGLEYGTVSSGKVIEALIADQCLHRFGDVTSDEGMAVKQRMMDAFYPDDPEWRASVYGIAQELIAPFEKK